ncbi:MAG: hypothetical protein HRU03_02820 [Nanoarchaeales archaeon]|nr:hypothetical protein [Nanoarchaeales archaeon]
MNTIETLEEIGMTQSEAKTFLTLLKLGAANAGDILDNLDLHQSVIHRALNSLIEKGLINYTLEGKKRIYQANDPKQLYNLIDDKKNNLDNIYEELQQIKSEEKEKENATIYKGKKGISEVYSILVSNTHAKEYLSFGGGKDCVELMGVPWWHNVHIRRAENKIKARQVFDKTVQSIGKDLEKKNKNTKIKYLSKDFESFQETVICGDFVAITVFADNPYSFLIKDEKVAEGYRKHFELLWKNAN